MSPGALGRGWRRPEPSRPPGPPATARGRRRLGGEVRTGEAAKRPDRENGPLGGSQSEGARWWASGSGVGERLVGPMVRWLDLKRRVLDVEVAGQAGLEAVEERPAPTLGETGVGHDDVGGEDRQA